MESDVSHAFSAVAVDHALHPRHLGPLETFNGHARITGPCGDTMEFWVFVRNGEIEKIAFVTDGCGCSLACGSMATCLACGRKLEEAVAMQEQAILEALGRIPPDSEHCALLAATTLKAACENFSASH